MTPREFLELRLRDLSIKFPHIHIKYGYDNIIETHIVELNPVNEYYYNKELDEQWIPISIDFMKKFDYEEIAFVSSDSTLSIKEIIFEFTPSVCTEIKILSNIYLPLIEREIDYTFSTRFSNGNIIVGNAFVLKKQPIESDNTVFNEDSYLAAA